MKLSSIARAALTAGFLAFIAVPASAEQNFQFAFEQIKDGRNIFRHDTFGDEAFWGDTLRLHEAISRLSPKTALATGLKVLVV